MAVDDYECNCSMSLGNVELYLPANQVKYLIKEYKLNRAARTKNFKIEEKILPHKFSNQNSKNLNFKYFLETHSHTSINFW